MSKIEWTDKTWNPITGCRHVSEGCRNCYAERDWKRLAGNPRSVYHGRGFNDVMCHPERLRIPMGWRTPKRIFVNSMSDLFHPSVPRDFIDRVHAVMALCPQHQFQILTKRAAEMREYYQRLDEERVLRGYMATDYGSPGPGILIHDAKGTKRLKPWPLPNVHLGVSVEDQKTADERIPILLDTPAAVRWVSYEPALGPVEFGAFMPWESTEPFERYKVGLDWIVAGGESGPNARPSHPRWFRAVRDQCKAAGVPFYMKQMGGKTKKTMPAIPDDLMIREYPDA